jgi:hypothetical protein
LHGVNQQDQDDRANVEHADQGHDSPDGIDHRANDPIHGLSYGMIRIHEIGQGNMQDHQQDNQGSKKVYQANQYINEQNSLTSFR